MWKNLFSRFHENIKKFACDNCDKKFTEKKSLLFVLLEIASLHSQEEMSWLVRHVRGVHDKKKPHNCEKCEKTYSQQSHLNEHISRFHENIKKFACDNCDKKFTEKSHIILKNVKKLILKISWNVADRWKIERIQILIQTKIYCEQPDYESTLLKKPSKTKAFKEMIKK